MPQHRFHPHEFLPLTPALAHILLALADEDRHGYAIMQEVERMTGGAVRMGPGTLYGTIKRMIASGLIEEADERPDPALDDERRRYYRSTALGRDVLAAETERMAALVSAARAKRVRAR
jgi:DNA-binding PadR family transcriptional regulator